MKEQNIYYFVFEIDLDRSGQEVLSFITPQSAVEHKPKLFIRYVDWLVTFFS